jgi:transposase
MEAYSMDLRVRVVAAVDAGEHNQEEIAQRFQVSSRWIRKLLRRRELTGSIAPLPHGGGQPPKLDTEAEARLRQQVHEQPDATLEELKALCGATVSRMTIWRAVQRLGLTRKKKVPR